MVDLDKTKQDIMQTHDVLKTIYFVVTGLSITKSLELLAGFFGMKISEQVIVILLFISFLFTIVRFCQGVSRVLAEPRTYVIFDFYGFFLQSIAFFFMAVNIKNVKFFIISFLVMLFFDSAWLIYNFCKNNNCTFTKVERQWLHSNVAIIILYAFLLIGMALNHYSMKEMVLSILIFIISIIAAIFDEAKNKKYYIGESAGQKTAFLTKPYFKNFISFIIKG